MFVGCRHRVFLSFVTIKIKTYTFGSSHQIRNRVVDVWRKIFGFVDYCRKRCAVFLLQSYDETRVFNGSGGTRKEATGETVGSLKCTAILAGNESLTKIRKG